MTRTLLLAAVLALAGCNDRNTLTGPERPAPIPTPAAVCVSPIYSIAGHAETCESCFEQCQQPSGEPGPPHVIPCRPDQLAILKELNIRECP